MSIKEIELKCAVITDSTIKLKLTGGGLGYSITLPAKQWFVSRTTVEEIVTSLLTLMEYQDKCQQ